ncbi:MAG: hypothetical protein COB67_10925 [SAR324 cluster bacterium]|uniref:Outer-membrane lipoprotein carrier protein n=1 Tax=SAR324 cluster bacterium TaxID=2024889 RepID=A0A2A4SVZ4_9DELT|nr:MAG: hypothetical protein COB67_10925 [SAR324 cluster bacterium]
MQAWRNTISKTPWFLLLFTLLFIAQPARAVENFSHFVDQYFDRIQSFEGKFNQEYYDALQEKKVFSNGQVRYLQPGLMKWVYLQPDELEILIGRQTIWIIDPILENVTIQPLDQVTQINALSFLLDKTQLREHFYPIEPTKSWLDSSPGIKPLFLAPKKKSSNLVELQLGIDEKSFSIRQFVIIDAQQNYRKVTFSQITLNPVMSAEDFEYQIPEDMEIIDGINN